MRHAWTTMLIGAAVLLGACGGAEELLLPQDPVPCGELGETQQCGSQLGVCTIGERVCMEGGWSVCIQAVSENQEICNGLDDDSDGRVDEGLYRENPDGPDGIGRCGRTRQACIRGDWSPWPPNPREPIDELCNGLDDDCDGRADEGYVFGSNVGICQEGVVQCQGGRPVVAQQPIGPDDREQCNGLDDDCDGRTDEDGVCQDYFNEHCYVGLGWIGASHDDFDRHDEFPGAPNFFEDGRSTWSGHRWTLPIPANRVEHCNWESPGGNRLPACYVNGSAPGDSMNSLTRTPFSQRLTDDDYLGFKVYCLDPDQPIADWLTPATLMARHCSLNVVMGTMRNGLPTQDFLSNLSEDRFLEGCDPGSSAGAGYYGYLERGARHDARYSCTHAHSNRWGSMRMVDFSNDTPEEHFLGVAFRCSQPDLHEGHRHNLVLSRVQREITFCFGMGPGVDQDGNEIPWLGHTENVWGVDWSNRRFRGEDSLLYVCSNQQGTFRYVTARDHQRFDADDERRIHFGLGVFAR